MNGSEHITNGDCTPSDGGQTLVPLKKGVRFVSSPDYLGTLISITVSLRQMNILAGAIVLVLLSVGVIGHPKTDDPCAELGTGFMEGSSAGTADAKFEEFLTLVRTFGGCGPVSRERMTSALNTLFREQGTENTTLRERNAALDEQSKTLKQSNADLEGKWMASEQRSAAAERELVAEKKQAAESKVTWENQAAQEVKELNETYTSEVAFYRQQLNDVQSSLREAEMQNREAAMQNSVLARDGGALRAKLEEILARSPTPSVGGLLCTGQNCLVRF